MIGVMISVMVLVVVEIMVFVVDVRYVDCFDDGECGECDDGD